MDTLSEVLRTVRLTGAVYFSIDGSAPWVAETLPGSLIAPHVGSGVEHVINYHVVTSGSCWAGPVGAAPFRLETGDVIVFPQGDAHVLSSHPGMRGRADVDFYRAANSQRVPLRVSLHGGGPERAQIVCGFLGCDARPFNPLLGALPRVLHLPASRSTVAGVRPLLDLALAESTTERPGSDGVLSRLSELLFVEVIRAFTAALGPDQVGWFAGLRDPVVGAALQKLHEQPAQSWDLVRLAKEVGASRTILAQRFRRLMGMPPMQYLARWRVQMAASLLRTTSLGLGEIAERVGYGSEPALSRAFKRSLAVAPAAYRRGAAADPNERLEEPDEQSF